MSKQGEPPIISIVGMSGSGKTTLLEKLIPELKGRGLRVATIKHDVHGFEMDKPGKDSWRHKRAGAATSMISSPFMIGMVMDADHDHSPEELGRFLSGSDIILTEGYKQKGKNKLEVFRPDGSGEEPICRDDKDLIALISDMPFDLGVPRFTLNDISGLADFIISRFELAPS
ncbi:Molybdopterin-guanine dinucleotide biosynthesis adapter protein [uncultured Desulfobacterium sp.]|uniref:Molybdopterin-guanine dinucleotide biosynthesis adapter protein n=1 Tax=uncultured Desulfobacterium sp. TaxID=201089 RepID=A0A445MSY7_9BACT|nr:Molybdopterin-guanine dinucleotide biosynthesis adapter protein [uncultured Desulfobacterium sp.]